MFDGGMGTPLVVPQKVSHGSPEWRRRRPGGRDDGPGARPGVRRRDLGGLERRRRPVGGARRRDEEGGLVGRRDVDGGGAVEIPLAPLPDVAGPYQDCPRWGADPRRPPVGAGLGGAGRAGRPGRPALAPGLGARHRRRRRLGCTARRSFAGAVSLPRDPDGPSTAWLEQVFDEPVQVGAVTVGLPGPRGFAAAPPPSARAGGQRRRRHLPARGRAGRAGNADKAVPVRTLAFPPVTARRFRLVLTGASAEEGLPPAGRGRAAAADPAPRSRSSWSRSSRCSPAAGCTRPSSRRVSRPRPTTTPWTAVADDRRSTPTASSTSRASSRTASCAGRRRPAPGRSCGSGASLTGQTNGPASPEATGLEVDKLDAAKVRALPRHLPRALRRRRAGRPAQRQHRVGRAEPHRPAARAVHRAARLRPEPWLPALAGLVVGDAARTDRFLWDFRQTDRRPRGERVLRHARGRGAPARPHLLRRGARGPPSAARQRPGDAQPRRRADGRDVAVRRRHGPARAHLPGRPEGRVVGRARLRQAVHRRRVDDRLPPPVELHAAAAQAHRRPGAGARRDPVLHPHLAAPADPGAAARHRAGAVPRAGVHPHASRGRSWPGRGSTTSPAARGCSTRACRPSTSPCSSARRRR